MEKALKTKLLKLIAITTIAALAPLAQSAFAQEDDSVDVRVVKKKVQISCDDGEDCAEGLHEIVIDAGAHGDRKVLFVGDDGETRVLSGDGHSWISKHGEHSFRLDGGGFLGVHLTELTDDLRDHFGVPRGQGVMISKVVDDSPAFRAGLAAGDIVTAVAGNAVKSGGSLSRAIRKLEDGDVADLEVWRDGSMMQLSAQIEERKSSRRSFAFHGDGVGGDTSAHANVFVVCDDEDGDCPETPHVKFFSNLDCDGDECEIEVNCENGDCVCTVNGEVQSCE